MLACKRGNLCTGILKGLKLGKKKKKKKRTKRRVCWQSVFTDVSFRSGSYN